MADVGNVDAHFPKPLLYLAYAEGVVEVLGVGGVDGEGEDVAHVESATDFLLGDARRELLGGLLHECRIGVGQSVLCQDGVHLGGVLAGLAEDVHDLANGILGFVGPLHDAHHGFVARLALLEVLFGDEDVVGQGAVLGEEVGVALLHLEGSDEGLVAALENFGDGSLADVVLASGQERDLHGVAVHGMEAVALSHQDGFAAILGLEGVLAVCFAVEDAAHHLLRHVQRVAEARLLLDEIVHEEVLQHIHQQHLGRVGVQMKLFAEGLQREDDARVLLKEIDDDAFQIVLAQPAAAGFLLSHK